MNINSTSFERVTVPTSVTTSLIDGLDEGSVQHLRIMFHNGSVGGKPGWAEGSGVDPAVVTKMALPGFSL